MWILGCMVLGDTLNACAGSRSEGYMMVVVCCARLGVEVNQFYYQRLALGSGSGVEAELKTQQAMRHPKESRSNHEIRQVPSVPPAEVELEGSGGVWRCLRDCRVA